MRDVDEFTAGLWYTDVHSSKAAFQGSLDRLQTLPTFVSVSTTSRQQYQPRLVACRGCSFVT